MAKQAGLAGWLAGWLSLAGPRIGLDGLPHHHAFQSGPSKPNPSGDLSPFHNAIQDPSLISSAARRRTRRPLARRGAGTGR